MNTNYCGIDYSGPSGTCNRDKATGIRYGIIPSRDVGQAWYDESEPDYGEPTCPKCGNEAKQAKGEYARYEHAKHECDDFVCHACKYVFGGESAYGDPDGSNVDNGEIKAHEDSSGDIWVFKSPYYTHAQFCSPCAPGACYLMNPCENGAKAFCLHHAWFESGVAPYPVYSVATGEIVQPETK